MSNLFVLGLGLGTVFVGLICIIVLCKLMSAICSKFGKKLNSFLPCFLHLSQRVTRCRSSPSTDQKPSDTKYPKYSQFVA